MKCNRLLLNEYLDGQLPTEGREKVESHLEECPACLRHLQKLKRVQKRLESLSPLTPPSLFLSRLDERLKGEVTKRKTTQRLLRRRRTPGWSLAIPLAACLLLSLYIFFGVVYQNHSGSSGQKESLKNQRGQSKGSENSRDQKISEKKAITQEKKEKVSEKDSKGERDPVQKFNRPQPPRKIAEKKDGEKDPADRDKKKAPGQETGEEKKSPSKRKTRVAKKKKPSKKEKANLEKIPSPDEPSRDDLLAQLRKLVKKYVEPRTSLKRKGALLVQIGKLPISESYAFLERVMEREKEVELRRQALFAAADLGKVRGAKLIIKKGLGDQSWQVRDTVEPALQKLTGPQSTQWIETTLLSHQNTKLRLLAVRTLGHIGSVKTSEHLARAWKREKSPLLKAEILNSLTSLRAHDQIPLFLKSADSRHQIIRETVAQAAGEFQNDRLIPPLKKLLHDQQGSVREKAALAFGRYTHKGDLVPYLIKELKTRDLRVIGALVTSLQNLTGKSYVSPQKWIQWWKAKKSQKAPPVPELDEVPSFCGIPYYFNRIVFIMDISQSMKANLALEKKMLTRAIRQLPHQTAFNIFVFSNRVVPFSRRYVRANQYYKKKALHFIQKLKHHEQLTDTYKAFSEILKGEIKPEAIFFFGDGSSTTGKFHKDPERIVREISRLNLRNRTRIFTFGVFRPQAETFWTMKERPIKGKGVTFLLELAKKNRGRFYHNY